MFNTGCCNAVIYCLATLDQSIHHSVAAASQPNATPQPVTAGESNFQRYSRTLNSNPTQPCLMHQHHPPTPLMYRYLQQGTFRFQIKGAIMCDFKLAATKQAEASCRLPHYTQHREPQLTSSMSEACSMPQCPLPKLLASYHSERGTILCFASSN